MGRGHNKSNIRPVIGYSGRGFFKPSSESVLLTWENESTVTVCVLFERSKEIDTKGNQFHQRNYVRQTLCSTMSTKRWKIKTQNRKVFTNIDTQKPLYRCQMETCKIVFTVSNPWRVNQQINNPYLHKALSKHLHNKPD